MATPHFISADESLVLSVARKTTIYNKLYRNPRNFSWERKMWRPYYKDLAENPTSFQVEFDITMPLAYDELVWQTNVAAEDNPFGIVCVQGEPVFSVAEQAAFVADGMDIVGWIEEYDIVQAPPPQE